MDHGKLSIKNLSFISKKKVNINRQLTETDAAPAIDLLHIVRQQSPFLSIQDS
jgi:hypothetical protein